MRRELGEDDRRQIALTYWRLVRGTGRLSIIGLKANHPGPACPDGLENLFCER